MKREENAILALLFFLGYLSMGVQVYLIRGFLSAFGGSELAALVLLTTWMVITGAGALLGIPILKKGPARVTLFTMLLVLSVFPLVMPLKVALVRVLFFPYGTMVSLPGMLASNLLVQIPFCLFNGILFTVLTGLLRRSGPAGHPVRAYAAESAGSVAAGAVVNFILLWFVPTHLSLPVLAFPFAGAVLWYAWITGRRDSFIMLLLIQSMTFALLLMVNPVHRANGLLFPGQRILSSNETPYGQVIVTGAAGQLNFYQNGTMMCSTGNTIRNEEQVHYAMIQHDEPRRVLAVGGDMPGILKEVLKYRPAVVDFLEVNPAMTEMASRYSSIPANPAVLIHAADGRRFLQSATTRYDVVLLNLPEPSTLQLNRFYTVEFIGLVKRRLAPEGVVALGLPTGSDYVSKLAADLNSVLFHTLNSCFSHVVIIPGERNYFIASDGILTADIPGAVDSKGISTNYVNRWYLDSERMKERSAFLHGALVPAPVNRDYQPLAFFLQTDFLISYFDGSIIRVILPVALLFLILLIITGPVRNGLLTGGFATGSLQVMILVAMQINLGYYYQAVGALTMAFMSGLWFGSWQVSRRRPINSRYCFLGIQGVLVVLSLLLPLLITSSVVGAMPSWLFLSLLLLSSFLVATATAGLYGCSIPLVSGANPGLPGIAYAIELVGSAIGTLIFTLVLFPKLGLQPALVVVVLLNLLSMARVIMRR